jgi:hypothetical protein
MVEIFKTNVENIKQAKRILMLLNSRFPKLRINFDLEDCDRILRVEGETIQADKVVNLVKSLGYQCEVWEIKLIEN